MSISRPLVAAIAAMGGMGAGGFWGWNALIQAPLGTLEKQATAAKTKKDKTYRQVMNARIADAELADFERLSLPGQPSQAQERFQNELIDTFRQAGIVSPTLTPGSPVIRADVVVVPYTIQGEANQAGVARLLYELRKAPKLRQIKRLSLTPVERAGMAPLIRLNLTVEALGLGDAVEVDAGTRMPPPSFEPTVRPRVEAYTGWFGRNVLSARGPSEGELPARSADYVALTGIAGSIGSLEASVFDRATGKSWKLKAGDRVTIRGDDSVVRDVGMRDLILESKGAFSVWQLGTAFAARRPTTLDDLVEREARRRQARPQ